MRGTAVPPLDETEVAAFWAQTSRTEAGCLDWTGQFNGKAPKSYGLFTIRRDGQRVRLMAHRVALALATRADGMFACHHCDRPPCVEPTHLYWGDPRSNADDMVARGRARQPHYAGRPDPLRPLTKHSRWRRPDAAARLFRERHGEEAMPDDFDYAVWRLNDAAAARSELRTLAERIDRGDGVDLGWTGPEPFVDWAALAEGALA